MTLTEKERFQFIGRYEMAGLTVDRAQRTGSEFLVYGDRQDLSRTIGCKASELGMTSSRGDDFESESTEYLQ